MKNRNLILFWLVLVLFTLAACVPETPVQTQAPATEPEPASPTEQPPGTVIAPEPSVGPTEPAQATEAPEATADRQTPVEQRIEFDAGDGTILVGSFYPATVDSAAAVILMHQFGSNRRTWVQKGVVAWLQNASGANGDMWPTMPADRSFAVFNFDFRGHGESGGSRTGERADFLMDAKAALSTVQELPGVDPAKIILIGASIGADAAIDVCVTGCLGALSLSPGGYLGVPYTEVVTELGLDNKPAWCLAAEDDPFSADTCKSASGASYHSVIYPQGGHGETLVKPGMDPNIGELFLEFLLQSLSGGEE